MKRLLLLVFPMILIILCFCLSSGTMKDIFEEEIFVEYKEITYAESNLGFVVEEKLGSNYLKYVSKGKVVGECLFFNAGKHNANYLAEKLGLMITSSYFVDGKQIVEGVSTLLKYKIDGKKANVQMAISDEQIIIGTPIIYGSY